MISKLYEFIGIKFRCFTKINYYRDPSDVFVWNGAAKTVCPFGVKHSVGLGNVQHVKMVGSTSCHKCEYNAGTKWEHVLCKNKKPVA